ncbi:MAG: helix-turn-helix domain-containing protein [Ilumatobacteraceae bacterium]
MSGTGVPGGRAVRWYQPVAAPSPLDRVLACSWSAQPSGRHRLVPDACIDLLWLSTGSILLCGPEATAWTFQLPEGVTAAGVRFRPGVLPALLGLDAQVVADRLVPWREVAGEAAERSLLERLAAAPDEAARMAVLEQEAAALVASAADPDPFAEAVVELVTRHPRVKAPTVAAAVGLTTRQLHRRCLSSFGYGLSTLARIVRFHRFWSVAELAPHGTSLATLAHEAGYTDHAHLVRDCRAITGSPPGRFLAESFATFPDMSDPYKTGRNFAGTLAR